MRSNKKWLGLITHASPYLLPEGANQEQVNLHCRLPGALQCRQGMVHVSDSSSMGPILDAYSLRGTQGTQLLALTSTGHLAVLPSVSLAVAPAEALEPRLSTTEGVSETNYVWQYQVGGGETQSLVTRFYGGSAEQASWNYKIGGATLCASDLSVIGGGDAGSDAVTGVPETELCDHADN